MFDFRITKAGSRPLGSDTKQAKQANNLAVADYLIIGFAHR